MFEVLRELTFVEGAKLLVEIGVLTYAIYRFYVAISDTKATEFLSFFVALLVIYYLCYVLGFSALTYLMRVMAVPFVMVLCVFYHPELRRAFSSAFSRKSRMFRMGGQTTSDQIDTILTACNILIEKKRGALVIFPRHSDIQHILESGTKLNAELSSALLLTIFDHDTPLHDGATVVIGGRIAYAACYLPLSEQKEIKATFGTRHRAALGLAEQSDAIVLIVSEETGAMSLAYNANIAYDLSNEAIKRALLSLFSYKDVTTPKDKEAVGEAKQ